MELRTTLLRVEDDGAYFRVHFPRSGPRAADSESSLDFKVTPEGALGFDNRQPDARFCSKRRISRLLAEEMLRTARDRIPDALSGRSRRGLAFELRIHYCCYRMGILRRHSVTTEMGSLSPDAADYDSNAALFEHPLRGIPTVLKALLRR